MQMFLLLSLILGIPICYSLFQKKYIILSIGFDCFIKGTTGGLKNNRMSPNSDQRRLQQGFTKRAVHVSIDFTKQNFPPWIPNFAITVEKFKYQEYRNFLCIFIFGISKNVVRFLQGFGANFFLNFYLSLLCVLWNE